MCILVDWFRTSIVYYVYWYLRHGSVFFIITVSLFSEGSLFIVPLYFTISPFPQVLCGWGRIYSQMTSPTQWPSHLRPSSLLLSSHPPLSLWLLNTMWTTLSVLWLPTVLGTVRLLSTTLRLVSRHRYLHVPTLTEQWQCPGTVCWSRLSLSAAGENDP